MSKSEKSSCSSEPIFLAIHGTLMRIHMRKSTNISKLQFHTSSKLPAHHPRFVLGTRFLPGTNTALSSSSISLPPSFSCVNFSISYVILHPENPPTWLKVATIVGEWLIFPGTSVHYSIVRFPPTLHSFDVLLELLYLSSTFRTLPDVVPMTYFLSFAGHVGIWRPSYIRRYQTKMRRLIYSNLTDSQRFIFMLKSSSTNYQVLTWNFGTLSQNFR